MKKALYFLALLCANVLTILLMENRAPAFFVVGQILGAVCLNLLCLSSLYIIGQKTRRSLPMWLKCLISFGLTSMALFFTR